jgi:hypothetical protein
VIAAEPPRVDNGRLYEVARAVLAAPKTARPKLREQYARELRGQLPAVTSGVFAGLMPTAGVVVVGAQITSDLRADHVPSDVATEANRILAVLQRIVPPTVTNR